MNKLSYLLIAILLISSTMSSEAQVISRLKQPPPNRFGISDLWSIDLNNTTRKESKVTLSELCLRTRMD